MGGSGKCTSANGNRPFAPRSVPIAPPNSHLLANADRKFQGSEIGHSVHTKDGGRVPSREVAVVTAGRSLQPHGKSGSFRWGF
jgi:hypothetical protein